MAYAIIVGGVAECIAHMLHREVGPPTIAFVVARAKYATMDGACAQGGCLKKTGHVTELARPVLTSPAARKVKTRLRARLSHRQPTHE